VSILTLLGVLFLIGLLLYSPPISAREAPPTHFGLLETWVDFQAARELGIQWDRGHLEWDMVQKSARGDFTWWEFDSYVRDVQRYGFELLITIFPFAPWDQAECHVGERVLGPPCNMDLYRNFVKAAVERYDGDGEEDMPGLRYPIHHWEAFNEPSMKDLPPFYDFTPQEYFELLKATYEEVKSACPQCKVLQAGVAGIELDRQQFLRDYLALGAGKYFDIANIHFIHSGDFETLNVKPFKDILHDYSIEKPIWVTEVQIESGPGAHYPYLTDNEAASLLVKGYTRAFSLGTDKLFYVVLKPAPEFPPNVIVSSLIDSRGRKRATYFAMKTMIKKLGNFTTVEKLSESQFKFETPQGPVYVVWNCSGLSEEQFGKRVLVTDISGEEKIEETKDVKAGDDPIFIEPIKE